ncbi:hypothetical protein Daus18300_004251 [Diaporthe australafricana]|uniref:Clr5 domain-containing protein n=1 Tax=Diaporthe australafricana TaxID=127596 RepID=A0ABR3XA37_9PEZI
MPQLKHPRPNEDDEIWHQNAAIMRQLYQEERKTLKEVKAIMENEKASPTTPLSTWETKLRELGLQKKLKARDWSLIYQHVRPRLQQEGAKKLSTPTVILINGTKKPWVKCWKEMRRNSVLNQGPYPEEGIDVLREYLNMDLTPPEGLERANSPGWKERALGILFLEQLQLRTFEPDDEIYWKRMLRLIELEVDLTWLTEEGAANALCSIAGFATSGKKPDEEHGLRILHWLLGQDIQVQAKALSNAVQDHEIAILELLADYCFDIKQHGVLALLDAACRNNFDASRFLLARGVDPNSVIVQNPGRGLISVFGAVVPRVSLEMMKYLVEQGAEAILLEQNPHPADLLLHLVSKPTNDLLVKVQYIIDEMSVVGLSESPFSSAHLLEVCVLRFHNSKKRREVFEFLLKRGASVCPGSPLAAWIAAGGGHHLVQEMLDAGAEPDAYSYETGSGEIWWMVDSRTPLQAAAERGEHNLVCLLLERGVDVNLPALGDTGMTALQAICLWDPATPEERARKDKILRLLLDKGAEVNAPSSVRRWTALCAAAMHGDLATAFLLLKHVAEINMVSDGSYHDRSLPSTALDVAAECGRLDMVEFLLNANALSSSAGPEEDLQRFASLDETKDVYYPLEKGIVDSGTASAGTKTNAGNIGVETTDVSCSRVVEEVEDESTVIEFQCEDMDGANCNGTAAQCCDDWEVSSVQQREQDQPRAQEWDEIEEHVASQGLAADVFMGFSESPIL